MVGTLATAGFDQQIILWDPTTGASWLTIPYKDNHDKQVNKLQFVPESTHLAVGGFNNVKLYDVASGSVEPIAKFEGHKNNITHVGFHRAGKWMYTSSEDGTVKVWDMRAKKFQRDFKHPGPVNTAALHPNQGEIIAGDSRGNVCVWDLGTAKLSTALRPEPDVPVQALSIADDNSALAAATNSGTVYVWAPPGDSAGYTPVHQLQAHRSYVLSVKLSPDGTHMATCAADKTVKLWDCSRDFAPSGTLTGHTSWVWDSSFTVDGQYLVTASSDKTAKLWEVASCECVHTYSGHSLGLQAAALADEMTPSDGGERGVSMASAGAAAT